MAKRYEKVRWGILGPGAIAHKFVAGLSVIPDAEVVAVGSRSKERANAFADEYGIPRRYGSYQQLVEDPDVDVIYVATPHSFHKEHTLLCLKAGKAVLCEKPMGINAGEVAEMIQVAREKQLFLMEAMWTRFLPVWVKIRELLADGVIGEPRMLMADFGFRAPKDPGHRLFNPELAGGALLDVGVYTISLAYMVFGKEPADMVSLAHLGDTGVDEQGAYIFRYDNGALAVLASAVSTDTPQAARIMGTKGSIYVPNFWHATSLRLELSGKEPEEVEFPSPGNGYNFEALEVMRCLREGKLESEIMPLNETLKIAETMDRIRTSWGLKYPME